MSFKILCGILETRDLVDSRGFKWHPGGDPKESRSVGQVDRRSLKPILSSVYLYLSTLERHKADARYTGLRFQFPWGRPRGDFQLVLQIEDSPTPFFEKLRFRQGTRSHRCMCLFDSWIFYDSRYRVKSQKEQQICTEQCCTNLQTSQISLFFTEK